MSTSYIGLPRTVVDPTEVKNANYEYRQSSTETSANVSTTLYEDFLSEAGLYLYELRVAGSSSANFCTIKRTFTVRVSAGIAEVLDISSDYTKKTDGTWNISVTVNANSVLVNVTGSAETIKWVASVTKTFFTL